MGCRWVIEGQRFGRCSAYDCGYGNFSYDASKKKEQVSLALWHISAHIEGHKVLVAIAVSSDFLSRSEWVRAWHVRERQWH